MLVFSCENLFKAYGGRTLFDGVGFELYEGDRVGLVGPNGVGKTTLMRILAGLDASDGGEARFHAGSRCMLLEQHPTITPGRSLHQEAKLALEPLIKAQEEFLEVTQKLATASEQERARLSARYERLSHIIQHHDAYNLDRQIDEVLQGLAFSSADYHRELTTFSGGQQSRVMLAKLLLAAPDVMFLDEPSNHLDIATTEWLEEYLSRQSEAMLIVSHDRKFLDHVTTKIFELSERGIAVYPGNYSAYVRQRKERYELAMKTWESQKEYIEKQEDYIRRASYGQLAKQAQSRIKSLEKLERVEKPILIDIPHFRFESSRRAGDVIVDADRISMKLGDKQLFTNLSFQIQRGTRIGIVGPNGCGKTSLLRCILGELTPDSGELKLGYNLDIGYYDQHLADIPEDIEVIRAVWPDGDPTITEQQMRDFCAKFGLFGEMPFHKVGSLSGGERSRVVLARLTARNVNLLILDEPTNHLDIWACEALEEALQSYEGTVIIVSHDRTFLSKLAQTIIAFDNGNATYYAGDYEMYRRMVKQTAGTATTTTPQGQPKPTKTTEPPPTSSSVGKRKRKYPFRKVSDIEAEIAVLEELVEDWEGRLQLPETYRDASRIKELNSNLASTKESLAELYEHWEEAMELNPKET